MIVRFVQRNQVTEQVLPAGLQVEVVRRENHIFGGPKACELEVSGESADMLEMLGWLRDRIEIFDDQGVPIWWGIVSRVEVPVNQVVMVSDLENMANAIKVVYTLTNASGESTGVTQETDWVVNLESVEQYGRKELLLSIGDSNAVAADTRARIELRERAFPQVFGTSGGKQKKGRIEGIGEWETLGWQYANVPTRVALAFQSGGWDYALSAPEIKVAQSFRAATDFQLSDISVRLKKIGAPGDLTLEVLDFVAEDMPGDVLASVTIKPEMVSSSWAWVRAMLAQAYPMAKGKRYFLAVSTKWCDLTNHYKIDISKKEDYPEGSFRINVSTGWQSDPRDMAFQLNQNALFLSHSALTPTYRKLDALTRGYAQQINLTAARKAAEVGVYLRRAGDPGRLSVTLAQDNGDTPGQKISTANIQAVEVGTAFGWKRALFDQTSNLTAGKYWLCLEASQADAQNYFEFQLDGNQGYPGGIAMHKTAGSYVDVSADMPFRTWHNRLAASYTSTDAQTLVFGEEDTQFAQTFTVSKTTNLSRLMVLVKKFGSPGNLSVAVVEMGENGEPSGANLGSGSIEALDVGTSASWHTIELSGYPQLTAFTQYALVFSAAETSADDGYILPIDGSGAYPGQRAWRKLTDNAWIDDGAEMPFKTGQNALVLQHTVMTTATLTLNDTVDSLAQTFGVPTDSYLSKVKLYVKKFGSPGDLNIRIMALDAEGNPQGEQIDSGRIEALDVTSAYQWLSAELSFNVIRGGIHHAIVLTASNLSATSGYTIQVDGNGSYANFNAWRHLAADRVWEALSSDIPFQLFRVVSGVAWGGTPNASRDIADVYSQVAQKITATTTTEVCRLQIQARKVGLPEDLSVALYSDNNGIPGSSLGSYSVDRRTIGGTYQWITGWLNNQVPVVSGQAYWIVVGANATDAQNRYEIGVDSGAGYTGGVMKLKLSGNWEALSSDIPFQVFGVTEGTRWGQSVNAASKIGGTYSSVNQQITALHSSQIVRLEAQARKIGNPGDLTIGLYSDAVGWPGALLGSFSVDRRTIGSSYQWVAGWTNKQCQVETSSKYWIVVSANNVDDANYYDVGIDTGAGYSGGVFKLRQAGSWTAQNFDMPFRLLETAVAQQHSAGTAELKLGVDYPMAAQKVTPTSAITLTGVGLKLAKAGQPGNVSVDVCKEINGFPGEVLGTATIYAEAVGGTAAFVVGALDQAVELENGNGYFLVVKAAGTSEISYYRLTMDAAAGYAGGFALVKAGDVWADGGGDMPFRLYSNDMVETSQQIQSLLTAYGQFFSHIYVDVDSGVNAESYRGGDTDAKVEIEKMLEGGNGENLRLVARVNYDRTVEVRTQEEESLTPMVEMRDDGMLWYRSGTMVEPAFDPTGKWISLEPILRSARFTSVVTGSQQSFILGARWDAKGKLEAQPAGWENNLARKVRMNNG